MKTLTFNGKSTNEFGIVIQEPPVYDFPEKDYSIQHVPGRTGDIVVDLGSYKNTQRTYNMVNVFTNEAKTIYPWKTGTTPLAADFITRARAMVKWFMDAKGYCRLEDDYEPDVYRKAMYYAGGSFTNLYDQGTAIQATFECKPQRFYKVGSQPTHYEFDEFMEINNVHKDDSSYPVITFNANTVFSSSTSFVFERAAGSTLRDNFTFEFTDMSVTPSSITIDWENRKVYDENGNNLNEYLIIKHTILGETTKILENFPENIFTLINEETGIITFSNNQLSSIDVTFNWWYI